MKKRIITICAIAATVILVVLIGCAILWSPPSEDPTVSSLTPVDDAVSIYDNAISDFRKSGSATMEITTTTQLVINREVFTEHTQKRLSYRGLGTEEFAVTSDELLTIGDHALEISEAYSSGTAYVTIDESNFRADYSAQDYQKRLVPAVLFDPALYWKTSGLDNGSQYLLSFKQPKSAEHWVEKTDWDFADAQGFALVDYSGKLLECTYSATYHHYVLEEIKETLHLTVNVDYSSGNIEIKLPEDSSRYTHISYLDGPRMLEKASGYLLQADTVSSVYQDRVFCQAFGDEREKYISLHTANSEGFSALVNTETQLSNTGRVGDITHHLHSELFTDGVYTIRVDDGEPTENDSFTVEAVQDYCKNQLVSTIMLPRDILDARITETELTLEIRFIPKVAFASIISTNACQTLYQKPELLNELADGNTTETLTGCLTLNKRTGLPLSSGIEYGGLYNIEGLPYQLEYKADQSYHIPSTYAQDQIKEAAGR